MRKDRLEKMKVWLLDVLEVEFFETFGDDGEITLISGDVILSDLHTDKVTIMFKSDLYPDDVAITTLIISDFVKKFRYKGVMVGELFAFDKKDKEMFWGKEAIEKFEKTQYEEVEEDVKYNLKLDYLLAHEEGHPC